MVKIEERRTPREHKEYILRKQRERVIKVSVADISIEVRHGRIHRTAGSI